MHMITSLYVKLFPKLSRMDKDSSSFMNENPVDVNEAIAIPVNFIIVNEYIKYQDFRSLKLGLKSPIISSPHHSKHIPPIKRIIAIS